MSRPSDPALLDLAAEWVTDGLDDARRDELLNDPQARAQATDFELAASATHMALLSQPTVALPQGLEARILGRWHERNEVANGTAPSPRIAAATEVAPSPGVLTGQDTRPVSGRQALQPLTFAGWFVAAAALALCVVLAGRLARLADADGVGDPALARARLLAEDPGAFELAWVDSIRHATSVGMSGSVVWSDARDEGYLSFSGLAQNDPAEAQYQLWIFRGTDLGAEPYPVDGGVFDVSAEGAEIVVPIDPKLELDRAASFVVTLERPGGVVVSDRTQIVAVAQRAL